MKILHSADWHLDSPLGGFSEEQAKFLRAELLKVPDRVAALCKSENCDLLLLAGDLFDGDYTRESLVAVQTALKEVGIPVFIAPGNHDFCRPDSPYMAEDWPENVHIFKHAGIESVSLPELDCKVYGAGYEAMDCPGLLKDFQAHGLAKWHIGLLHSDPLQSSTPYCPVTTNQIRESALSYLAMGHIHKGGSFRAGETLCAWPGCPMGRGYDEPGVKGVLVVELDNSVSARFLPLSTPDSMTKPQRPARMPWIRCPPSCRRWKLWIRIASRSPVTARLWTPLPSPRHSLTCRIWRSGIGRCRRSTCEAQWVMTLWRVSISRCCRRLWNPAARPCSGT